MFLLLYNTFFWIFNTYPPPHNANNFEPYISVTRFFREIWPIPTPYSIT